MFKILDIYYNLLNNFIRIYVGLHVILNGDLNGYIFG